ncbi:MAG: DoxX family membrane protein [Bacteroidetes bacterium]|nr:DoxX family membrane protein [Bacteroidota bacterium]
MKLISHLGRFIFAGVFIIFGLFHFMKGQAMAEYILPEWPVATILVYVAGAGMILAGVSIIINFKAQLASLLLALLLFIFILVLHLPKVLDGDQLSTTMLLKDAAMMGAALYLAGNLKK